MSSIRTKMHRYGHVPNRNKFVIQNWRFSLLYKIHLMDKPNSWLSKHLSKKGKIPNKVYDSSGTDICYVLFFAHWRHALLKKLWNFWVSLEAECWRKHALKKRRRRRCRRSSAWIIKIATFGSPKFWSWHI